MLRKHGTIMSVFFVTFFLILASAASQEISQQTSDIAGKKLALIIAYRDFEDTGFRILKKILDGKGALITIASSKIGTAKGMYSHTVKTDILIEKLDVKNFDAIIFMGGTGVRSEFWDDAHAHRLAREAVKEDKIVGATSWAPVILANAGILEGKQSTENTYKNAHKILISKGAQYTGEAVSIDGKIITGSGPESIEKFAKTIVAAF